MTKSQIPTTQPPNHSDIGHWSLVIGHCAKVLDERCVLDYDTPENRFVLHVMHLLLHRLRELSESPDAPPQVHRWLRQISALMREGLWDEIEPSPQAPVESLTLQLDPRYRTVFEVARLLQWGLGEWDGRAFRLSNRQTHELYEYWTFLNLIDLLREFNFHAGEQELSNLIRLTPQGLRLTLTVGEPSKVRLSRGEMQVTLTYQRAFSTITHRMVPDVTVELLCPGQPVRTVLFDAKYRVEQDASGQWGPTQEDIDQMHCYRDGIAPVIGGGVEGAFVLFPLEDEDGYRKHRYFLSIADGIGAFPLLPGSDSLLREWLSSWLGVEKP